MSRIIKARQSSSVIPFDFREIEECPRETSLPPCQSEAGMLPEQGTQEPPPIDPLEELEETIRSRLLEAERKAQEMEKEAYAKGYAQGEKDGIEYGRKSMEIVKERLEKLAAVLDGVPRKICEDYRDWFITTSLTVARHVAQTELQTNPPALVRRIEALLGAVESHDHTLTISLHPRDIELLEKHTDFSQRLRTERGPVVLKADPDMERGGCRAESDIQLLDATMEAEFTLIEETLRHGPPVVEPSLELE